MYKTSVYTLVNGKIEELSRRKQQKSQKVILTYCPHHTDCVKKDISLIKKKNFAYISPICREAALGGICITFCITRYLPDVINRAKFYLNRVKGFDSVGVEFLDSP